MTAAKPLRVLVVDDDVISSAFFQGALARRGDRVDPCDGVALANELLARERYDLALVDLRLPDGRGADVPAAYGGAHTRFVALSAELPRDSARMVETGGFSAVLAKPCTVARLNEAIARVFAYAAIDLRDESGAPSNETRWRVAERGPPYRTARRGPSALLDDGAGLRAAGSREVLLALRGLFVDELTQRAPEVVRAVATGQPRAIRELLHQLTASCFLVGAVPLGDAARSLRDAIDLAMALAEPIARFDALATATLAELAARRGAHAP